MAVEVVGAVPNITDTDETVNLNVMNLKTRQKEGAVLYYTSVKLHFWRIPTSTTDKMPSNKTT